MATEVNIPRLGQGMEVGTVVRWLKAEGEPVAKGDLLYEIDTDKATQEVEAEAAGVLLKIVVPAGEFPVGTTIAWIGEAGEDVSDKAPPVSAAPRDEPLEPAVAASGEPEPRAIAAPQNGRVKASPLARRIARERGVDLRALAGTGPEGRIVADDVERVARTGAVAAPRSAAPSAPPPPRRPVPRPANAEPERVELTRIRRTIARRLTEAWEAPVFQLTVDVDMTRANALVDRLRALHTDVRITHTDLLTKICAVALVQHPGLNVHFMGSELLRFPTANVGIAVAAPSGLVVPVVPSAERLTIPEIAAYRGDLVARARDARLQQADLDGGTFTISNLGMFGIDAFIAVLNPPQAAILAVGRTRDQVVPVDGQPGIRAIMTATLTVDHRAVDGAEAADFLGTVRALLEEPGLAL